MNQAVLDFDQARRERDAGMHRASEAAQCLDDSWPAAAYAFLYRYALTHQQFISEEATAEADRLGYASPTSSKAWGAIFQRASREGIIRRNGYGTSARRHLSPTPMWQSMVFVGEAA